MLILYNANVITMDPAQPRAELVAIAKNRIALVAGNQVLGALKKQGAQSIDCAGKTMLPGFVDAHCHVHAYAESLVSLNLSQREEIGSIADIQNRIREFCNNRTPGSWIRGKSYNEFCLAEKRHPNRWDLDAAAPLHPVKLTHRSGHAHVLNSLALKLVQVNTETGDPSGGLIDRDPQTGVPTGILYGMGEYLAGKIPLIDGHELERAAVEASARLLSYGITSVHDASSVNDLRRWKQFENWKERNIFQPRVTMMLGLSAFSNLDRTSFSSHINNAHLRLGSVKIIAGQATGSLHPSQKELDDAVSAIHAAGCQVAIHAVEEPVIEAACNAVEYALSKDPRRDHRHRIEHCSECPPPLLRRLAALGMAVVTQPAFIYYEGDRYLSTVPEYQQENLYSIGSMLGNNLLVGFSSDFPIADPNPMAGIYAAVTRQTESGYVFPQQRISLTVALKSYTWGAAAAGFEETIKGSVSPGKLADLVVFNEDPSSVAEEGIKDIRAALTILGGRVVWSDGSLYPAMPFSSKD